VNLTGQTYPIRPIREFEAMLDGCAFDGWPAPYSAKQRRLIAADLRMDSRRRAVEYIVATVEKDVEYCDYFRRTVIPDEVFFATLLHDCTGMRIGRGNFRHIFWPSEHAPGTAVMDARHFSELEASNAYFALKFDETTSAELLACIDRRLGCTKEGG
jgi:hypothetical protein